MDGIKSGRDRGMDLMKRSGYTVGGLKPHLPHVQKLARGGSAKKSPHHVNVTVVVPPAGQPAPQRVPVPVPVHPPMAAAPHSIPAGVGPRPGMPPAAPVPAAMPRKRGGAVPEMKAGAGGAKGRMEKIKAYGGRD